MSVPENARRASPLLSAAAYLTTLAVFLISVFFMLRRADETALAIVVGIFVAFTVIESILMLTSTRLAVRRVLFFIQGALTAALFFALPNNSGIASILLVLLAAQAFFSFDPPEQLYWGLAFLVEIFALLFINLPPLDALLNGLIYAGIFAFMWAIARALQREQNLRAESQRLTAELENANAQLRDYALHAQELAIAQERTRMAREIHDSLGHHLTVLSVQLQAAQKLIEREPARAAAQIETARGVVAQALRDVRQSVNALRQTSDVESYHVENLAQLVQDFGNATGIATEYRAENFVPQTLSPAQALTVYRTVQEGLTNAQKHARATRVDVHLTQSSDVLVICVTDNGAGVENENSSAGYGLLGLRERVALLGGTLTAAPRAQSGFELRVELPLTQTEANV